MRLALRLAEGARGQTGVNPAVGCVIVKDGAIVGLGSHLRMGGPHAEILALDMAKQEAEGSTVYVTLEPCAHYGRTPPCCDRLIREKVRRVVVACTDPNPQVAGKGLARLAENGIEVTTGVLEREARELIEAFDKFIRTRRPFVTLKTACTLDGKIAARTGDSKWITGEAAREHVHALRHRNQAIMVGVGTVIADNPRLTARLPVPARQPVRIVADSQLRIPETSVILTDRAAPVILLTTEGAPYDRRRRMESLGAELIDCGPGPQVDLDLAMRRLGERGIGSILLEGGGRLNGAMLERGLIDKMVLFFAPKIIGGPQAPANFSFAGFDRMDQAIALERVLVRTIGQDICITGYPRYERSDC